MSVPRERIHQLGWLGLAGDQATAPIALTITGTFSGESLGLAIARSYARAHRGDLIYERGTPSGSRFQLVRPNR